MPSNHDESVLYRIGRPFTAIVLICSITSCQSLNDPGGLVVPELGPITYTSGAVPDSLMQEGWDQGLKDALKQAFVDAEKLDEKLYDAMWKNEAYSFVTGLSMFAAGIATLAFGVFDASRTLLLAGGVTTASLAGVRTFYPFQQRNALYAKGRTALQCAVEVTRTGIALGSAGAANGNETLSAVLKRARDAATELQGAAAEVAALPSTDNVRTEVSRALLVPVAERDASDLLAAAGAGRAVQEQLRPELQVAFLQNAITKIHAIIDSEANKLQPDPEGALAQARSQLTANLAAVKEPALEARRLAGLVDNNRPKVTSAPSAGGGGAATKEVKEVVEKQAEAATAADDLKAKMQTIDAKLSNIDSCIAALTGSGT